MSGPGGPRSGKIADLDLRQTRVGLRSAVAIELPEVANFAHHVPVHVGDQQFVLVLARLGDDLAARVDEISRAIEPADAPRLLRADAVDRADITAVGHGGCRLLELPQILAEAGHRGRGIDDVLGAVQRERAPALRKVPVVADIDTELAEGAVEHPIAAIARLE